MKARKAAAADKPTDKRTASASRRKLDKGAAVAADKTLRELLGEIISGQKIIADRIESVRRTLWRTDAVRNYNGKGADAGAEAVKGGGEE